MSTAGELSVGLTLTQTPAWFVFPWELSLVVAIIAPRLLSALNRHPARLQGSFRSIRLLVILIPQCQLLSQDRLQLNHESYREPRRGVDREARAYSFACLISTKRCAMPL